MSATQREAIRYFCQQKGMTEEQLTDEINNAFEQPSRVELIHALNKGAAIGRREMLDNACEWLKKSTILADTTIERFKKAMEEQQ